MFLLSLSNYLLFEGENLNVCHTRPWRFGLKIDPMTSKKPNAVVLFLLFYGGTLLLAAAFAPLLFFATKYLAETFSSDLFHHFLDKGFEKFFARAKLIAFCALLVPLLKISAIGSEEMGFSKISKGKFCSILFVGFTLVLSIFVALAWRNAHVFGAVSAVDCVWQIPKFITVAATVSFLEEVTFRGIIFRLFARNGGVFWATIFTALFFAHCHVAIGNGAPIAADDVTIFSGFRCLVPSPLEIFRNFNPLHFLNLGTLGILLTVLLLKFGSLLAPIAFHFGAVFAIVVWRHFVKITEIVGDGYRSIGILDTWITFTAQWLAVILLIFSMKRQMRREES